MPASQADGTEYLGLSAVLVEAQSTDQQQKVTRDQQPEGAPITWDGGTVGGGGTATWEDKGDTATARHACWRGAGMPVASAYSPSLCPVSPQPVLGKVSLQPRGRAERGQGQAELRATSR